MKTKEKTKPKKQTRKVPTQKSFNEASDIASKVAKLCEKSGMSCFLIFGGDIDGKSQGSSIIGGEGKDISAMIEAALSQQPLLRLLVKMRLSVR